MKPTYKTPTIRNDRSGLTYSRGFWRALYYKGEKRLMKSMRTKDLAEATKRRDDFYASLDAPVIHGDGDRFVYKIESYVVKIRGRYVGSASTIEEARAMRDKALR
jgi:hypothetical protein